MAHNRKVQEAVAAKDSRAEQLKMGLREDKDQLSQVLVRSLRPKASLRLDELLEKHKVAGVADCHDGAAMLADLVALRGTTGVLEETRDHDREVERMRDEFLADGCDVHDFTDKVNELRRDPSRSPRAASRR